MLVLLLAVAVAAALTLTSPDGPVRYLAAPVDAVLDALVGTVDRIVEAVLPSGSLGTLVVVLIALVTPGLAAVALAFAASATMSARRVILAACAVLTISAYLWMEPSRATLAAVGIGLIAAAVGFGTRWLVVAPLALLAATLAFRTLLAHLQRTAPAWLPTDHLAAGGGAGDIADTAALVLGAALAAAPFVLAGRWLWRAR